MNQHFCAGYNWCGCICAPSKVKFIISSVWFNNEELRRARFQHWQQATEGSYNMDYEPTAAWTGSNCLHLLLHAWYASWSSVCLHPLYRAEHTSFYQDVVNFWLENHTGYTGAPVMIWIPASKTVSHLLAVWITLVLHYHNVSMWRQWSGL